MQCTGNSDCFSRGKRAATVRCLIHIFVFLCVAFWWLHTTGCGAYSFTTNGYGIINVRTNLGTCRKHKGGGGGGGGEEKKDVEGESVTNKSVQELTRRDTKSVAHPAPPGDRTHGLSGVEFRRSNH